MLLRTPVDGSAVQGPPFVDALTGEVLGHGACEPECAFEVVASFRDAPLASSCDPFRVFGLRGERGDDPFEGAATGSPGAASDCMTSATRTPRTYWRRVST